MRFKANRSVLGHAPSRPFGRLRRGAEGLPASRLQEKQVNGTNPGALEVYAYVPARLPKDAPLVVILHGCGQTAASYDEGTGWTILAEELGFAVLAPQQVSANNANGCFNWFEPGDSARDHGEAASIHDMIGQMVRECGSDPSRVFITGLSAGGAMTAAMLAAYPELFAGGAILAGLAAGSASNIPEALRSMRRAPDRSAQEWGDLVRRASADPGPRPIVSIWHGDADLIVHPGNGEALALQWTDAHGLALSAATLTQGENFRRRAWSGEDGRVAVELIEVASMGHGVPVSDSSVDPYGRRGVYFLDAGLSSTARIAAFWGFKVRASVVAADRRYDRAAPSYNGFQWEPPSVASAGGLGSGLIGVKQGLQATIMKSLKAAGVLKG